MKKSKGKDSKISTYAVIMLLAAIIVIIIAAMADNREQVIADDAAQTMQSIQEEIARLETENYKLNQEIERLNADAQESEQADAVYSSLAEVWQLHSSGNTEEAAKKLAEIDAAALSAPQSDICAAITAATAFKEASDPAASDEN